MSDIDAFYDQVGSDQDVDQVLNAVSSLKPGERIVFEDCLHIVATEKGFLFLGPDDGDWVKKPVAELQKLVAGYLDTGTTPDGLKFEHAKEFGPVREMITRTLAASEE